MTKPHLRDLTKSELESLILSWKVPRYRADQILQWIYQKNAMAVEDMQNLPHELHALLNQKTDLNRLTLISMMQSANGESIKFLTKTPDGHLCETVLITQQKRRTVCISTQLGCRIRCIFCASGKGKFGRNLTAGEMMEQISMVSSKVKAPITNVVFMGMGEPLDNYDQTMKALEILQAKWGFALSARRITVSTSGITPKILSFVKTTGGRVRLSVSLHSAINETRSYLVPINKKYGLAELTRTLDAVHQKLKRDITFEYTLIEGVNDSMQQAEQTAKLSSRLKAKVNIIPYNPIREMDFKTPSPERIKAFQSILEKRGIRVMVRQTAGRDIDAACGQLRLKRD
ncbi:MAG: 23S rRNA (adenine(2503)-C(2))-methyltransferase RlmN [Candidatus Omnitrophica bacterium CG11_big_fil_rev_8_21_14_0_20_45_26]|uniref:Probable dual-specificity RNA methyltransferase RlmN n=1 Tax=Candidatus Abzuiibacterium crystallinum TaxID=1974748 RepID=A0A2H0LTB4_9BACT|nr:MAG: 23S rRNA (adenine(2503)-C(2))-methyltransferase RlmN [Candidatus Omnitrophica bacterium CG11_big_fil_rev_8_21_14_0_20_45_26]PIW65727.1 MAG: 23S rRNA (adenine(2503)-C(2))-methyltransferase RlmN [Candidatus Omnitrophica bacterium CG12_big_fil_rev_8_21_14_0_65_45_16]